MRTLAFVLGFTLWALLSFACWALVRGGTMNEKGEQDYE